MPSYLRSSPAATGGARSLLVRACAASRALERSDCSSVFSSLSQRFSFSSRRKACAVGLTPVPARAYSPSASAPSAPSVLSDCNTNCSRCTSSKLAFATKVSSSMSVHLTEASTSSRCRRVASSSRRSPRMVCLRFTMRWVCDRAPPSRAANEDPVVPMSSSPWSFTTCSSLALSRSSRWISALSSLRSISCASTTFLSAKTSAVNSSGSSTSSLAVQSGWRTPRPRAWRRAVSPASRGAIMSATCCWRYCVVVPLGDRPVRAGAPGYVRSFWPPTIGAVCPARRRLIHSCRTLIPGGGRCALAEPLPYISYECRGMLRLLCHTTSRRGGTDRYRPAQWLWVVFSPVCRRHSEWRAMHAEVCDGNTPR
mmetsp:Transcript_23782/g.62191  ORF Transcript_23782/g.62191 Transcript_23782/m.62191 type:complete len:368 (-) Transcript_23782:66-1169(-)